jgi:Co/Zn/Cd efflux system component
MFVIEFTMGLLAHSSALMADSLDMLGDALVYLFSLYVLHKNEAWRSSAAFLKGLIITFFGVAVLIDVILKITKDITPVPLTMGAIGGLALAANIICLLLLMKQRDDDINMKSTYLCSRNDIITNCGVLVSAFLVGVTGSRDRHRHWTHHRLNIFKICLADSQRIFNGA